MQERKVVEVNNIKSNSAYGEVQAREIHEFNRKWIEDQFQKIDVLTRNTSKLIELLEPKEEKVDRRQILYDFNDKPYAIKGDCPRCSNGQLVSTLEQYCPKCGQKLDWSE